MCLESVQFPRTGKAFYKSGLRFIWGTIVAIALIASATAQPSQTENAQDAPSGPQPAIDSAAAWQYGAFADFGYLQDFNDPANHLFRSRGTTFHVNELDLNMAALYLKKVASNASPWGTELTLQAGKDSEAFGFSATAPNLDGSKWLRHLGPTDLSYLALIGRGLTLQGEIGRASCRER